MLRHRNFNFIGLYAVRWKKNLQKLTGKGKIRTLDCEISVSSDKIGFIWCLIISYVDQHVPGVHKVCEQNFLPCLPHVQEELEIVETWVNQKLGQCMCYCFSVN